MTATTARVCWVDEEWDRANASDRVSRYGAYLRGHAELFDPSHDAPNNVTEDPGEFAIAAFQVACGPIMSPGYVCWHPRILDHQVNYGGDPDPTRLICQVTLASFLPMRLGSRWGSWTPSLAREGVRAGGGTARRPGDPPAALAAPPYPPPPPTTARQAPPAEP